MPAQEGVKLVGDADVGLFDEPLDANQRATVRPIALAAQVASTLSYALWRGMDPDGAGLRDVIGSKGNAALAHAVEIVAHVPVIESRPESGFADRSSLQDSIRHLLQLVGQ